MKRVGEGGELGETPLMAGNNNLEIFQVHVHVVEEKKPFYVHYTSWGSLETHCFCLRENSMQQNTQLTTSAPSNTCLGII